MSGLTGYVAPMKLRTPLVLGVGVVIGYLAGSAAGRERYDKIVTAARRLASDAGLDSLGEHVGERGLDVAQATTDAASGLVDAAADKVTGAHAHA